MPRRSPIVFWLLLLATLAVDVIVCIRVSTPEPKQFMAGLYTLVAFLALILSQLSLVCIWSGVRSSKSVWTRIAPLVAVATAVLLHVAILPRAEEFYENVVSELPYYGLHAALVLVAIWQLQRTKLGRQLGGTPKKWQFSVAELLVAMTIVAVLASLMRHSWIANDSTWLNIWFVCSSVFLTVASTWIWSLTWHWPLQLTSVLGIAALLGAALLLSPNNGESYAALIGAHYMVQALVLSIWLSLGPILPVTPIASTCDSPMSKP